MKKKILFTTTILSIAVAGVVSAASVWGTYKGNDIIRLTVGGSPVAVSDVPAINYNNRTMIPIYLLQQAGIKYTWDQQNRTVDVLKVQNNESNEKLNTAVATMEAWAYCADYQQKLNDLTADFYNSLMHFNSVAITISQGSMTNNSEIDFLYNAGTRLQTLETRYNEVNNIYKKKVHDYYTQMQQPSSNLAIIESQYDAVMKSLTTAFVSVTDYQNSNNQSDFNKTMDALNTANSQIAKARDAAMKEFDVFQQALMNYNP